VVIVITPLQTTEIPVIPLHPQKIPLVYMNEELLKIHQLINILVK